MSGMTFDLNLSLASYIKALWNGNEISESIPSSQLTELFQALVKSGCDYYQMLEIYSEHELSLKEQRVLLSLSPFSTSPKSITRNHVRECIPRWTGSRFHTASISDVVESIYFKLLSGELGMSVYDSNRNPKNRKAANDRYILLIQPDKKAFVDINRRSTTLFE